MSLTAPPQSVPVSQPGLRPRLLEAISWRWQFVLKPRLMKLLGIQNTQWARVVSDRAALDFVASIDYKSMDAVEMSASSDQWREFGFRSYLNTSYPEYDLCSGPLRTCGFDLVIAEQVLEHVLWPYRAVRNVYAMLRPGGWFLVSTPFLIRVHSYPSDCCRWTEAGLKNLLIEGGFSEGGIRTGSWGNLQCVRGNFVRFPSWIPWWHSLRNEPLFPVVVWAFARKPLAAN